MSDTEKYDLVVIGSGPGGYVAAARAAQLGMKVACVEKGKRLGGVCLNIGCIPSKVLLDSSEYYYEAKENFAAYGIKTGRLSLDLATMMARKDQVVEELTDNVRKLLQRNKVAIFHGTARLTGPEQVALTASEKGGAVPHELTAKAILLATGSTPAQIPGIAFDGERIVSSTEVLTLEKVPGSLGIIGGGYIGLELGSVWSRLGAQVTVIEMMPQIALGLDGQVARALKRILSRQGLAFRLKTKVVSAKVSGKKVRVTFDTGEKKETAVFDRLMLAVGRRPLTRGLGLKAVGVKVDETTGKIAVDGNYRTTVPSVYAIGDIVPGPMLAHKASAEGNAVAECIAGLPGEVNYDAVPSVIYTWPEVASVGITEEQAKQREIAFSVGTYPFSGVGRARCMGGTDGFVKLIAHAKTDRILGAHIIGPRASELIAECVLAIEFGASAEDIARTIHGHPTFSEALQEAAKTVRKSPSAKG